MFIEGRRYQLLLASPSFPNRAEVPVAFRHRGKEPLSPQHNFFTSIKTGGAKWKSCTTTEPERGGETEQNPLLLTKSVLKMPIPRVLLAMAMEQSTIKTKTPTDRCKITPN